MNDSTEKIRYFCYMSKYRKYKVTEMTALSIVNAHRKDKMGMLGGRK